MTDSLQEDFDFPPRRETFLARYPRNVKMAAAVFLLAIAVLPPAWIHGRVRQRAETPRLAAIASKPVVKENQSAVVADPSLGGGGINDQNDRSIKLVASPDVRVTEDTEEGSLPRISEDGVRPWQLYSRPFDTSDKRPRVAIVVTGLGMSRMVTDQAIVQLPPPVTLALDAQGPVVAAWGGRARNEGHEILLQIPVEPFDYPQSDPGPDTLLTSISNGENLSRLLKSLRKATGYIGVTSIYGSGFLSDQKRFVPVLQVLRDRGLMVLDARAAPHSTVSDMAKQEGVPVASITQRLDADLAPDAIMLSLAALEKSAKQDGVAIGITEATPVVIRQLQRWAKGLPQRGIALAPLSAVVQ